MGLVYRMPWFKLYSGMLEKPRVYNLSDSQFRLWIELLCLANESAVPGTVEMDPDELAHHLRRDRAKVAADIGILTLAGLVTIVTSHVTELVTLARKKNGVDYVASIVLPDWFEKQQPAGDSTERMRRKRLRDKENVICDDGGVTSDAVTCDDNVTGRRRSRSRKEPPTPLPATPAGVRDDVWQAWLQYRGKQKAATIALQAKRLAGWAAEGKDPNEIIERSIANGWKGLFPPDAAAPKRIREKEFI